MYGVTLQVIYRQDTCIANGKYLFQNGVYPLSVPSIMFINVHLFPIITVVSSCGMCLLWQVRKQLFALTPTTVTYDDVKELLSGMLCM